MRDKRIPECHFQKLSHQEQTPPFLSSIFFLLSFKLEKRKPISYNHLPQKVPLQNPEEEMPWARTIENDVIQWATGCWLLVYRKGDCRGCNASEISLLQEEEYSLGKEGKKENPECYF